MTEGPDTLPYEEWALAFYHRSLLMIAGMEGVIEDAESLSLNHLPEAEEALIDSLNGKPMYDGGSGPENPPVPAMVAEVVADYDSATSLVRNLYGSLFEFEEISGLLRRPSCSVYCGVTRYLETPGDDDREHAGLADNPFFVIGLDADENALLFKHEVRLSELVCEDRTDLVALHRRLVSRARGR